MFNIDRKDPWPPDIDLAAARKTIRRIERDMQRVPQFAEVASALEDALQAIDQAELKSPKRLADKVVTHSRFTPIDD